MSMPARRRGISLGCIPKVGENGPCGLQTIKLTYLKDGARRCPTASPFPSTVPPMSLAVTSGTPPPTVSTAVVAQKKFSSTLPTRSRR